MTTTPAGITVSGLLQSLPETVGLDLDPLAGSTGLIEDGLDPGEEQ
jgi:hypothetical protein